MKKQFLPVIFTSLLYVSGIFLNTSLHAQTVIGGSTPDPSAELDVQSGNRGLLPPRLTTSQRDAIISPATGLLVFNTTRNCVEMNIGTPSLPAWGCFNTANGVSLPSATPSVCRSTALTPVTHATTGATGIGTATGLPSGVTAAWASNTITISGTPTVAGTFNYSIPLTGGLGAGTATGTITVIALNTVSAVSSNLVLYINTTTTNVTHTTTGATGIGTPSNLPPGMTASWASNTVTISGTPTVAGTYNYSIPLTGGCGSVNATGTIAVAPNGCGAFTSAGVWRIFKCHNLGADESVDPFTPDWRLNGDYYQWGRKPVAADGPSGPNASQANASSISGWNTQDAPDGTWSNASKTANDPCPAGFRVPTKTQWEAVINTSLNPTRSFVGSWSSTTTNYSSGLRIGSGTSGLFLPAVGWRSPSDGALGNRGASTNYQSSSIDGINAFNLYITSGNVIIGSDPRTYGFPVRCVAL